jgi:hypothetical protein
MSELLTDLVNHLQNVYTNHPGDDGRLIVAVPTTPYTVEHFEVSKIHHEGPSVVLYCQSPQAVISRPEEPAEPQAKRRRICVHNDYADLG